MTQVLVERQNLVAGMGGIVVGGGDIRFFSFPSVDGTSSGKIIVGRIKLKMPVFGPLVRKIALAKFTRTFSTLVSAGVPILSALDIVSDTAGNEVVSQGGQEGPYGIKEGETIAKPLSESKVFPSMVVQMISVGEETGALDAMLSKVADFYDEEVSASVDGLTSLIEPS